MKKYIILLFICLLGLSWYTAVSETVNNPREMKAHLEKAKELEGKEIYVDAIEEYKAALEYDPESTDIYMKMANAYLQSDNDREFIDICQQQAQVNQKDTEALNALMDYYVENDNIVDALQYLQKFLEAYPDNAAAKEWYQKFEGSYGELYCRYDEIGEIINHSMAVVSNELYGIADDTGRTIIKCDYKESHPFSEDGFALVQKVSGEYIYIDEDGQTRKVPDTEYEDLGMFQSERTTAKKNGKYGYLDADMNPIGEFEWDELTGIKNSIGAGKKSDKWVLFKDTGKEISDDKYEDVIVDEAGFCSSQDRIFVKSGGKYHIVDQKGESVGKLTFDDAKAFTNEGFAAVCKDGKWGFVDNNGKLMIDYTFDDAESFQNGYAAVCQENMWGYINEEGDMIIKPEFKEASYISDSGIAVVKKEEEAEEVWMLIQLSVFL